jgi:hypothetical protein
MFQEVCLDGRKAIWLIYIILWIGPTHLVFNVNCLAVKAVPHIFRFSAGAQLYSVTVIQCPNSVVEQKVDRLSLYVLY